MFHADRWDYLFYFKRGSTSVVQQRDLVLTFAGDRLASWTGADNLPSSSTCSPISTAIAAARRRRPLPRRRRRRSRRRCCRRQRRAGERCREPGRRAGVRRRARPGCERAGRTRGEPRDQPGVRAGRATARRFTPAAQASGDAPVRRAASRQARRRRSSRSSSSIVRRSRTCPDDASPPVGPQGTRTTLQNQPLTARRPVSGPRAGIGGGRRRPPLDLYRVESHEDCDCRCIGPHGPDADQAVLNDADAQLVGALDRAGSPFLGQDAGAFVGKDTGIKLTDDLDAVFAQADYLIDFTRPEARSPTSRASAAPT
jgi:outer membrane protein assembly factor BamE